MAIDKNAIMEHIRGILIALGDDPEREGLKETPERVANMYEEIFEGMNYTNREIADMFCKTFELPDSENDDMVIVKDIEVFSHCEHHLALMYDMKVTVAYIPDAKRLQLQEKLGADIAEIISIASGSQDVAVYIEGKHSCMTARGIKNGSSYTRSTTLRGKFKTDTALQNRLFLQIK